MQNESVLADLPTATHTSVCILEQQYAQHNIVSTFTGY